MKRYNTLVTARISPEYLAQLEPHCDLRFAGWIKTGVIATPEEILPELRDVEVFINGYEKLTAAMMDQLPSLRFVAVCRGNPMNVDVAAATERGIPVVYTPGRNANGVAEFTIGQMLALSRHIATSNAMLRDGRHLAPPATDPLAEDVGDVIWDSPDENIHTTYGGYELEGRTLGVIGLGFIGRLVTQKAAALGMKLMAYDPYCTDGGEVELVELDRLLTESDFISLHCKVTDQNKGMIGQRELSLMKPTASLINTARASLIDQRALLEALTEHQIGGAALDVFWKEPLPINHPLLGMDNVLLTPHLAGASLDVTRIQSRMIAEDVLAWINGAPLQRAAKV